MDVKPKPARSAVGHQGHAPAHYAGACRCDLHPRWDRTGKKVCVDSIHSGTRQMYVVDVGDTLDSVAAAI